MKTGAVIIAVLAVLIMWPLLVGRAADAPTTRPADAAAPAVGFGENTAIVELSGEINDFNRDRLINRINEAKALGAHTVILNIDSYGGMVADGLEISRFLKRQGDLHIVAFIEDKAISAGAMIAMACDEIVMSKSASLGDCAPIFFTPEGQLKSMGDAERAKQESPVLLDFAESAQRNHHDPLLAAKMVDVSQVVFWVQKDREKRFVNAADYLTLKAEGWKDVPGVKAPIADDRTLLTVTSQEALQYGLATGLADSAQTLAEQRSYKIVADLTPGLGEKLVDFLSGQMVRTAIMTLFFLCVFVIPHAPGHGAAESVGLGALVLMTVVPMLTGYAQWWELLVIFIGLGLVALEILLPGHMVPGITGATLVLLGLVMTFVPRSLGGELHFNLASMQTGLLAVASSLAGALIVWFWIARYLPRMPYLRRLVLTTTVGGGTNLDGKIVKPDEHIWPPIGSVGKATTDLRPGGAAEFFDALSGDHKIVNVVCETGFVAKGTELLVREVSNARVLVRVNNT